MHAVVQEVCVCVSKKMFRLQKLLWRTLCRVFGLMGGACERCS